MEEKSYFSVTVKAVTGSRSGESFFEHVFAKDAASAKASARGRLSRRLNGAKVRIVDARPSAAATQEAGRG